MCCMWAAGVWQREQHDQPVQAGPDGKTAVRVPVKVGRASVNSIQVLEGLQDGDTVILSDMSRWDNTDRIR
jgi:HlyD family secretion protein